jgi:DNA-binding HxlR family transcriptional regulator
VIGAGVPWVFALVHRVTTQSTAHAFPSTSTYFFVRALNSEEPTKEFSMSNRPYTCGVDEALSVVGGRWKIQVIWHLNNGPQRFGQLRRLAHGVSEKMLMSSLKELELDDVITRTDYGEQPPRVEYSLTPVGLDLARALQPLCEWGHAHMGRASANPKQAHIAQAMA